MTSRPINKTDILPLLTGSDITAKLTKDNIKSIMGGNLPTKAGNDCSVASDGTFDVTVVKPVALQNTLTATDSLIISRSVNSVNTPFIGLFQVLVNFITSKLYTTNIAGAYTVAGNSFHTNETGSISVTPVSGNWSSNAVFTASTSGLGTFSNNTLSPVAGSRTPVVFSYTTTKAETANITIVDSSGMTNNTGALSLTTYYPAASSFTVVVDKSTAKVGEAITATVSIPNNTSWGNTVLSFASSIAGSFNNSSITPTVGTTSAISAVFTGSQIANGNITVTATNSVTNATGNVPITVRDLVVPGKPTLAFGSPGANSIPYTITAPTTGDAATSYQITYQTGSNAASTITTTSLSGNLTGLASASAYTGSVIAINSKGNSVSSDTVSATTTGVANLITFNPASYTNNTYGNAAYTQEHLRVGNYNVYIVNNGTNTIGTRADFPMYLWVANVDNTITSFNKLPWGYNRTPTGNATTADIVKGTVDSYRSHYYDSIDNQGSYGFNTGYDLIVFGDNNNNYRAPWYIIVTLPDNTSFAVGPYTYVP